MRCILSMAGWTTDHKMMVGLSLAACRWLPSLAIEISPAAVAAGDEDPDAATEAAALVTAAADAGGEDVGGRRWGVAVEEAFPLFNKRLRSKALDGAVLMISLLEKTWSHYKR